MPNYELPQIQNPDILGAYLRGRAIPGQMALQQQQIDAQQQAIDTQGIANEMAGTKMAYIRDYLRQRQQGGQTPAGPDQMAPQQGTYGTPAATPDASNAPWGPGSVLGVNVPQSAMAPPDLEGLGVAFGMNPLEAHLKSQEAQQKEMTTRTEMVAQKMLDPTNPQNPIPALIQFTHEPNAAQALKNNPALLAQWEGAARKAGINPADLFSDRPGVADYAVQKAAYATALPALAAVGKEGLLKSPEDPNKPEVPITPYQQQSLGLERRRLALAERDQQSGGKPPSGYEADPDHPGGLRPIPGGPADPEAKAAPGMDSRSTVMFQRVVNSANAANAAIRNIGELPITASTGFFGTAQPGTGLLSSVRSVMGQKITSQEAQDLKTMIAGVSRNLATIETAGLAPNGSLTHSMDSITIGEGDTQLTKLRKMAEMRQIITENLRPQLSNPKLAPTQRDLVKDIIQKAEDAVPFTQSDITKFEFSKDKTATIMDFAKGKGLGAKAAASFSDPEKEARYQEWKRTHPNG